MNSTAQKTAGLTLDGKKDRIVFDDAIPGFGLRLREGGSRTWIYQFKLGAEQRIVIGKVSAMSAAKAREIAEQHHAKVKLGINPKDEIDANKASAADTFGSLVDRYLASRQLDVDKGTMREGSLDQVKRHLEKNVSGLHKSALRSVDQRAIAERLSAIATHSGSVTANRTRASISAMYGWAMGEGLASSNPVVNTGKREEKSRDRVLSDAELRLIWNALGDNHHDTIVKLLMLTAQRKNEIAALEWPELDFDEKLICLPAARTKNARVHTLPMSGQVRAILKAQKEVDDRKFVFGYRGGPFSGFSKLKHALDARIKKANGGKAIAHWTLHDLRRTAATVMADRLEIEPHIIEAILNHVSGHKGGVAGIYNRARYIKPMAAALTVWDAHLAAVAAGRTSNVTPMKRA